MMDAIIMIVSITAGWIFGIRQTNSGWMDTASKGTPKECRGHIYLVKDWDYKE